MLLQCEHLPFLWLNNISVSVHVSHIFFSHSTISGHEYFHILAIVNNAARDMGVHVSFQVSVFIFLG